MQPDMAQSVMTAMPAVVRVARVAHAAIHVPIRAARAAMAVSGTVDR